MAAKTTIAEGGCLKMASIHGRCTGGQHATGDLAHVIGFVLWCPDCCPSCHPPAKEWSEPMPTGKVGGEQGGLFG